MIRTELKRTLPTEPKRKRARSFRVAEIPTGERFGRWTVIEECAGIERRMFTCQCDCGQRRNVYLSHLRSGKSQQCKDCAVVKHRMSSSDTYRSYRSMVTRCTDPAHKDYARYGGRGIGIDPSWSTFSGFLSDMGIRPAGTTLDRIDNSKGYSRDNCRWATPKTQANNTSFNRIVHYQGKAYTCSQLAEHLGIAYQALYSRIKKGQQLDAPTKYSRKKEK